MLKYLITRFVGVRVLVLESFHYIFVLVSIVGFKRDTMEDNWTIFNALKQLSFANARAV